MMSLVFKQVLRLSVSLVTYHGKMTGRYSCGLWEKILNEYGIKVFHMADLYEENIKDPQSRYYGWSREKIDSFIHKLAQIARDNTLVGIGGLVSIRDYNKIIPQWFKNEIGHPYHFCFQLFFDTLLEVLRSKFEYPFESNETVAFFFHRQQQFKAKALQVYDEIRDLRDTEKRMGSITFADKGTYVPLQAADLLAFRMRKVLTRKLNGQAPITTGSWDEELGLRGNLVMKYYDAEGLNIVLSAKVQSRIIIQGKLMDKNSL